MRALIFAALMFAAPAWSQDKPDDLLRLAVTLENEGKGAEAVNAYVRAARAGSGKASMRLGVIYEKGLLGVARNPAESQKWNNAAKVLGEEKTGGWGCPPKC